MPYCQNNIIKIIILLILIVLLILSLFYPESESPSLAPTHYSIFDKPKVFAPKKYQLAILSIFKNEQDYMEEWLDHHIEQGVEHFYLYSNEKSKDDLDKYPYLKSEKYKGKLTIINWPYTYNSSIEDTVQKRAYNDCIKYYSHECQFLALLDLDEFIAPLNDKRVIDIINALDMPNTRGIKLMRFNYGSNGHIKKPKGKVSDNYKLHEKLCSSFKSIANTDYLNKNGSFYGVHEFPFKYYSGKVYNNYFRYPGDYMKCKKDSKTEIPLIIKHYYTKSKEEYFERCNLWKKGGVNPVNCRHNCKGNFNKVDSETNEIDNYRAVLYI